MITTLLLHKKVLAVIFIVMMCHGVLKDFIAKRNPPKDDDL